MIAQHIAGKPDIIVQNMPGAGSLVAANYVYGMAKPDGLTLGAILPAIYFDQLHPNIIFFTGRVYGEG
jgi:hypothetical protein